MKLARRTKSGWQYLLEEKEVLLLKSLLENFPFAGPGPATISRTDQHPAARERETLLNESLAEHRRELRKLAGHLAGPEQFQRQGRGQVLKISFDEREALLQILNDIRVGCWHALGQPETLEPPPDPLSAPDQANYSLMNIAGYFEYHLLVAADRQRDKP